MEKCAQREKMRGSICVMLLRSGAASLVAPAGLVVPACAGDGSPAGRPGTRLLYRRHASAGSMLTVSRLVLIGLDRGVRHVVGVVVQRVGCGARRSERRAVRVRGGMSACARVQQAQRTRLTGAVPEARTACRTTHPCCPC